MCFFFLSAVRTAYETWGLNLGRYLGTGASRIIYIVTTAGKCLVPMTVLVLVSSLLRYTISVEPMATTFMCFAMGLLYCLPCMTHMGNQAGLGLLICISDMFEFNIQIAKAISSLTMTIVGYLSKMTLAAIKQFRLRLICFVAAVLGKIAFQFYIEGFFF